MLMGYQLNGLETPLQNSTHHMEEKLNWLYSFHICSDGVMLCAKPKAYDQGSLVCFVVVLHHSNSISAISWQ